jgi:hypothetical protein
MRPVHRVLTDSRGEGGTGGEREDWGVSTIWAVHWNDDANTDSSLIPTVNTSVSVPVPARMWTMTDPSERSPDDIPADSPSDLDPRGTSRPTLLSDRQLAVYEALRETGPARAAMYLSAVQVLGSHNTEGAVLAAHALRELLDELPGIVGVEADRASFSYRDRVGSLRVDWDRAIENSICTEDGITWADPIDNALRRLLKRLRLFFIDERRARIPHGEGARSFIRQTDPLAAELPLSVEDARFRIWAECKGYFEAISHHDPRKDASAILTYVALLEDFLLDHLRPRTTMDQAAILSIIKEAEGQ